MSAEKQVGGKNSNSNYQKSHIYYKTDFFFKKV